MLSSYKYVQSVEVSCGRSEHRDGNVYKVIRDLRAVSSMGHCWLIYCFAKPKVHINSKTLLGNS